MTLDDAVAAALLVILLAVLALFRSIRQDEDRRAARELLELQRHASRGLAKRPRLHGTR